MAGPEYAKKTVAELQEILKSRSLPSSGKKADLIARLTEADKETEANETKAPAAEATTAPPDQKTNESTATTATTSAPSQPITSTSPSITKSQPQPDQTTQEPTDKASPDTQLAQSTSYALHLPQSDVDSEMAKRKARAERFGTGQANGEGDSTTQETQDSAALKNLERAKRFGIGQTAMGKLDEALPSELNRKRGKGGISNSTSTTTATGGPGEDTAMDDPGLIRRGGGGSNGRRGGRDGGRGGGSNRRFKGNNSSKRDGSRQRPAGDRPAGIQKPGGSAFSSEKDRLAAEARKAKFSA